VSSGESAVLWLKNAEMRDVTEMLVFSWESLQCERNAEDAEMSEMLVTL
jgi:hypothetical protein